MRPNDEQINPADTPSSPPPSDLPRPRFRPMNDVVRPTSSQPQQPISPQPVASRSLNDISPQQRSNLPKVAHPGDHLLSAPPHEDLLTSGLPEIEPPKASESPRKKHTKWKLLGVIVATLLVLVGIVAAASFWWYQQQLQPVDATASDQTRVVIEAGSTPSTIADQLKDRGLIRDVTAFSIYINLSKTRDSLKAGTYNLQKSESVEAIVAHLVSGKQDTFRLTFLPGDTIENHKKKIIEAGYSQAEVDAAFAKTYTGPLFAGKPASADLEGYIYGETYEFLSSATVEEVLQRTFTEFETKIKADGIVEGLKKQGLNLYQGITLASIVQKEVSGTADSAQVAQVFYKRLKEGVSLGADATFVYAAKKAGQTPSVDFKSPYNTRIVTGLPPGPISSPGEAALTAVAKPAVGDFMYFVSGDDGKNYFSRTLQEHEAKTRQYCIKNCALF